MIATHKNALMAFPFLALPTLYIMIVGIFKDGPSWLDVEVFNFFVLSGAAIALTHGDVIVALGLVLLFIEILKSVNTGRASLVNHGFSVLNLITCILLFIGSRSFAHVAFFLVTLMALIDVISGYCVSVVAARRDFALESGSEPFKAN